MLMKQHQQERKPVVWKQLIVNAISIRDSTFMFAKRETRHEKQAF